MIRSSRFVGACLLAALALTSNLGCAARAGAGDVARVAELSHRPLPVNIDTPVDVTPHPQVRSLLEAPLTAERAAKIALLNNRDLRAMLRRVGVARGHLHQAGLLPNPVVGVGKPAEHGANWEASAEFDLSHALLAPLRTDAAEPAVELARVRAAASVVETAASAKKAFFAAQAADEQLRLTKELVDANAAGLDAARALVESGNVPLLEVVARGAAFEQARLLLAEREDRAFAAREALQRTLGLFGTQTDWSLDPSRSEVPSSLELPSDLEAAALRASFELRATRERLEGLARQAKLQRTTGWVPDVALEVSALSTGQQASGTSDESALLWGAGVSVGLPLFDRRQGSIHALEAEFDAEMEQSIARAVDVRSMVRQVRFQLESAHARVMHHHSTLNPAQRELVAQTLLQVNAMHASVFTLLQARRAQLDVELAAIGAERDYWNARADLDTLLAGGRIEVGSTTAVAIAAGAEQEGGH